MKYVIYVGVALLVLWSVWYLVRNIRRQMKGDCAGCKGGGEGCAGCKGKK